LIEASSKLGLKECTRLRAKILDANIAPIDLGEEGALGFVIDVFLAGLAFGAGTLELLVVAKKISLCP
jgi:hypothetical protein